MRALGYHRIPATGRNSSCLITLLYSAKSFRFKYWSSFRRFSTILSSPRLSNTFASKPRRVEGLATNAPSRFAHLVLHVSSRYNYGSGNRETRCLRRSAVLRAPFWFNLAGLIDRVCTLMVDDRQKIMHKGAEGEGAVREEQESKKARERIRRQHCVQHAP